MIGQNKPSDSYLFDGKKREFSDATKKPWKSVEEHGNYFQFSPHLSTVSELGIYCSLIEPQPVNNSNYPLMRVINLDASPGRKVFSFGNTLQLMKLKSAQILQFTVFIRDLFGGEARLQDYTRLTLVIRPPARPLLGV